MAPWVPAAIAAGGSVLGGLLAGQNSGSGTTETWDGWQKNISKKIGSYLEPKIGEELPRYEGAFVAPMSRQENTGMSLLDNYAKSGRPQEYQWASGSLNNAFTGNYKPIVDPKAADGMYDAIKKRVLTIELPEIQNSVAKNANLSGMYHSGGHSKQQAQEAGNVATRLAETLAKLRYQDEQDRRSVVRERERRSFDAIPQAVTVGQAINQDPLNKAVASVQYGSLPRSLQQAELDADFSEYQRTQPENNPAIAQALSYLARQGYQQTDYSRSGFKMDPNLPAYLYDATYKYQNPPPPATTP